MQEFSEDLSSAAGAAASRFGTNVMGAFSLAAFRKAEAAAAEGERADEADARAAHSVAEGSTEVTVLAGLTLAFMSWLGGGCEDRLSSKDTPKLQAVLTHSSSYVTAWINSY